MKNILIALLVLTAVLMGGKAFADENVQAPSAAAPDGKAAAQGMAPPDENTAAPDAAAANGGQSGEDVEDSQGEEEEAPEAPAAEVTHYQLAPEIDTWLGYRFFDMQGSRKAAEYEYPYSSVVGGLKMLYVPLPTRWEADLDWVNPNDWNADASLGYRDILKINYTGWALWRNYNHYGLIGRVPTNDRAPGASYFTDDQDNRLSLVIKWPDRPYHFFMNLRQFEKDGTVQARYYEGTSVKGSRSRDIDWITRDLTAGINGHFGPVEAEYSHTTKTFDPHKDVALVDVMNGSDLYHSVVPQFDENLDSVKIHTDYTGRISADAQYINGERENQHSQAEVNYQRAYGDFNLIPLPGLTMVVRYRFNQTHETVPTLVPGTPPNLTAKTVNPIDDRDNKAQVAFRYSPVTLIAFKAEYSFENLKRYNADLWSNPQIISQHILAPFGTIPSEQNIHKITAGVTSRPARWVDFKGSFEYTYTEEPAYALSPKNSYKVRADANFMPLPEITSNVHYRMSSESNGLANMHTKYDNPGIQAVWAPPGPFTLSVNYDYFRYRIDRDILLFQANYTTPFPEERAPYTDQAHVYSVGGTYSFPIPLTADAEFYQSFGSGSFRINEALGLFNTLDVGLLADMAVRETGGRITGRYTLPKDWGLSLTYDINNYVDFKSNTLGGSQSGPQNGTAQTVMIVASKKW
jgi:hypothetical protein